MKNIEREKESKRDCLLKLEKYLIIRIEIINNYIMLIFIKYQNYKVNYIAIVVVAEYIYNIDDLKIFIKQFSSHSHFHFHFQYYC